MNYGPLLFLAAFFALASSWCGFVLAPQLQVGQLQQTNDLQGAAYPVARPGLARQGLEVYRANGCATCHSQQVGQTRTTCEVLLTDAGTNRVALLAALLRVQPAWSEVQANEKLSHLPEPILRGVTRVAADAALKTLNIGGAKAQLLINPGGPDIARGWGKRRTVAEDFLFDYPVMPGSLRAGPDLANVGVRQPDPAWHLRHFYSPRLEVKGSTMPAYRFLFEKRKIERAPSPDALALPAGEAPPRGYEIVPRPEAKALAAYMLSLRADAPLFVAPWTAPAPAAGTTNSPSGGATNAPPQGAASTNAAGTSGLGRRARIPTKLIDGICPLIVRSELAGGEGRS